MEKQQFELLSQYLNPDNISSQKSKTDHLISLASELEINSENLINNLSKAPHFNSQLNDTLPQVLSSFNETFSELNSEILNLGNLLTQKL